MTKYFKLTLAAALALSLSALIPIAANAQAAPNIARPRTSNQTPKVVFIGDQFTYMWAATPPFAANPNWINQGWAWTPVSNCFLLCTAGTSESTAARFQTDVIDLHPAIVHILVGADDLSEDDDATQAIGGVSPGFLTSLE
jgi:hypothetical protein